MPETDWVAPLRGGNYPYGKLLKAQKVCEDIDRLEVIDGTIEEGFHAYLFEKGDLFPPAPLPDVKWKRCIIPKGAEYCEGKFHEIVSTRMIVFKNKFSFVKYLLRKPCHKLFHYLFGEKANKI